MMILSFNTEDGYIITFNCNIICFVFLYCALYNNNSKPFLHVMRKCLMFFDLNYTLVLRNNFNAFETQIKS